MKLIVGLGNPGQRYRHTRHNIGFMVLEEFAAQNHIKFKAHRQFKALTGEGVVREENIYLAMPQTYMNLSGYSVRQIVNWLKLDLSEMLLVIDDIVLPFGVIRMRPKGSDGGHKGLRSVIDCLGDSAFSRMRIGIIGRENIKDCSKYVLSGFTKKEKKDLARVIQRSTSACDTWIREGIIVAMNRYNANIRISNADGRRLV